MISTRLWREHLGNGSGPILVDTTGSPFRVEGLPDDAIAPALVVGRVSEAVKEVEGETVMGYLNRDAMWAVEGFVLSDEVMSILPEEVESAASLIEIVARAGFRWNTVLPAPPPQTE